jgi:two-component system chemotaxis sensor kinase CheA
VVRGEGGGTERDEAVYELITYPGLSTVEEVTSTSGRGVGMDVVRESVEAVNGHLTVESTPGEGTVMRIRVPVTMAVTDLVFVETCGQEFALPVADVVRVDAGERIVDRTEQKSVDRRLDLGRALEVGSVEADTPREVTVETPDGTVAVGSDEVLDQRNAIVTPYDELLAGIPELSGATTGTEEQLVHVLEVTNI